MNIICFIGSLGSGGAERQMVYLASFLKQEGHDVTVVTYHPDDFYKSKLEESQVDYICADKALNKSKRLFILRKIFKSRDPDVVIAFGPAAVTACLLKISGMNFKLIASERNTTQELSIDEKIKFFLFRFADVIVPNSFSQSDFIYSHFPHLRHKLKVITNFVDTDYFKPNAQIQSEFYIPRILVVARVMPQKNVLLFIEAVKKVRDLGYSFKVDWFGAKNSTEFFKHCGIALEDYNLHDFFEFHEPSSKILNEYCSSDVFCLPSLYEGFPNVLCEAMSCGLPILCSNVCDNPSIIENEINGYLFNPNSVDEISNSIIRYLNLSQEDRSFMALSSRSIAQKKFSKSIFVGQYLNLLNKLNLTEF